MSKVDEQQKLILNFYAELTLAFQEAQNKSALLCPPLCGRCCHNPEIEATPLEFIPLALELYQTNRYQNYLEQYEAQTSNRCLLFQLIDESNHLGQCMEYRYRPTICRAFGVAGVTNKSGNITPSVCSELKNHHPEKYQELISSPTDLPILNDWNQKLMSLIPDLIGQKRIPISKAIYEAINYVVFIKNLEKESEV